MSLSLRSSLAALCRWLGRFPFGSLVNCKTLLTPALSLSAVLVSSCLAVASVAAMMLVVGITYGVTNVVRPKASS